MRWEELAEEFRSLGGVFENTRIGKGAAGRGVFVLDPARDLGPPLGAAEPPLPRGPVFFVLLFAAMSDPRRFGSHHRDGRAPGAAPGFTTGRPWSPP